MWLLLMLIILLANGISSFGLKVLTAWGLSPNIKYPYLTVWYIAGLVCIGAPMLLKGLKGGIKEIGWGAALAALSIGGQLAMANALQAGLPGNVVFPVTIGGSILIVALAGRLYFAEKMHPLSWAGVGIGCLAVILLSVS
jgi:multidrug transporter EmrE-like cation transporter